MLSRSRDERGVTTVLVGLAAIAVLALAGVVIDGGNAYADRRQVQNAADSAALDGTYQLNKYLDGTATSDSILTAVQTKLTQHHVTGPGVCEIVDVNRAVLQACPTTASSLPAGADGVKVTVTDQQTTYLIRVVGINNVSARANATAQVEALHNPGDAVFVACGLAQPQGGQNGWTDLNATPASPAAPLLLDVNPALQMTDPNRWAVNVGQQSPTYQSAVGLYYDLHDQHVPTCYGGGSGFKGWAQSGASPGVPGWWDTQAGTRAGPARSLIAGLPGCSGSNLNNCYVMVPLCVESNGANGANYKLYCVRWGTFQVFDTGNGNSGNSHAGRFIGEGVANQGTGGGIPQQGEARLIKLSD